MRLWVDDTRSAPEGYVWCKSVNEAIAEIKYIEAAVYFGEIDEIELIDLDYDSGDYIKLMDWLVERGTLYSLVFHS